MAPTGFGKTAAVIISWLYKRLTAPDDTPRRLVFCLPMRTLVEQTAGQATTWCHSVEDYFRDARQAPPAAYSLLGGQIEDQWRIYPEHSSIIVGTQDMLLSRALMRGYGMSRFQWPIDFAMLHNDALWIFDEVQLMGAGFSTSAQVEAFRRDHDRFKGTVRPSQTLWMSATFEMSWLKSVDFAPHVEAATVMTVTGETEPAARGLWTAAKRLQCASFALTKANEKKQYPAAIATAALQAALPDKSVLVIVNRVARAQDIFVRLQQLVARQKSHPDLVLIHSRYRQSERAALSDRVNSAPSSAGRIIVSTQAVEAGVDITSAAMLTELAPWSSLVQRFGRCNRSGEEADAYVIWIDAERDGDLSKPYDVTALDRARTHLLSLNDVGLKSVAGLPPDSFDHNHVIRARDFIDMFDTDADLSGFDIDISPYIRDADDTDVRVFWRDLGERPDLSTTGMPARNELCAVSIGRARAWLVTAEKTLGRAAAFRFDPLAKRRSDDAIWKPVKSNRVIPGQTLLVDVSVGGYDHDLGFTGERKHRPEPIASAPGLESRLDETLDDDAASERRKCNVGLRQHLTHVMAEASALCCDLALDSAIQDAVTVAAAWHDVGKTHVEFQTRMGLDSAAVPPVEMTILAKSREYRRTGNRPYFRHELASMLAWFQHHRPDLHSDRDLIGYLIAAHHGKVRMNLRALPGEAEPDDPSIRFARGLWDGDLLPALEIPGWGPVPATTLSLELMELGNGPQGRSWGQRTHRLLRDLGPFKLALLETLVRIADWRASAAEENLGRDDV
jgi:CRISPR-associated endonuclease/helicase Cas3